MWCTAAAARDTDRRPLPCPPLSRPQAGGWAIGRALHRPRPRQAVTSGPDPQGSGHSSQLPGAPGRMRTRRSGGRGASLSWSLSTPRNPRQQTPAPLYVLWARPPASSNSKRPSIPFNLSRGGSPGRHRKRTLSLITASHLCPRGPDWPLKGLRAEQAVGPTPRFSEGPGVKPGSREGSGGWGPGWQDAEGRGPGPQGWGAGESPPASTQTRHLTTAWVALRRRSSAVKGQLQGRWSMSRQKDRLQHRGPAHTAPPGRESRLHHPGSTGHRKRHWWGLGVLRAPRASREGGGQLPTEQSRAQ